MWVLGHTVSVKVVAEIVVMRVMLVSCSRNIYHAQYRWVVHLLESMIDFEQVQGS